MLLATLGKACTKDRWSEMTWPGGNEQPVVGIKSAEGNIVQDEPREEGRGMRKQDFLS